MSERDVLRMRQMDFAAVSELLAHFGLGLRFVENAESIPGSYWGEDEAGIIGHEVFVRAETPVHSVLHEAGHLIVLPPLKREQVHTDATDSVEEENAVCVLQALLADALPGVGRERVLADMDAWGYTFRLGSAQSYVEQDAEDAWEWLLAHELIDADRKLLFPTASLNKTSMQVQR